MLGTLLQRDCLRVMAAAPCSERVVNAAAKVLVRRVSRPPPNECSLVLVRITVRTKTLEKLVNREALGSCGNVGPTLPTRPIDPPIRHRTHRRRSRPANSSRHARHRQPPRSGGGDGCWLPGVYCGEVDSPSDDAFDGYLDAVLIGGLEERELILVDYTPAWESRFARERVRILEALGEVARRVEHVGSTAVPDLAAKPIVDILVAVDDPDDESGYLAAMEGAGYELRVREAGHRMFRTPERDVHVHVWKAGSDDERRHLVFRDWLRRAPDERALYESVKRRFVGEKFTDMNYYARAKGPIIEDIIGRAEAWAAETEPKAT